MIVVFSYSYGLTGAEVGIAGGSAVLGQKLLEAVFGDQAVRSLAERARTSLEARVRELFGAELARYTDLLDAPRASTPRPPSSCGVRHAGWRTRRYAGQRRQTRVRSTVFDSVDSSTRLVSDATAGHQPHRSTDRRHRVRRGRR